MSVLIALGTTAAYAYSLAITLWGDRLGRSDVYFETGAVIITLIILGKYLEAVAKGRTSEAIKKLMGLQARGPCGAGRPETGHSRRRWATWSSGGWDG
ncbi:MAG TPA: hypothetical protein VGK74_12935 [Symbiobacteriaceae bacterium]|jgi:Cu+-exporting ATPase